MPKYFNDFINQLFKIRTWVYICNTVEEFKQESSMLTLGIYALIKIIAKQSVITHRQNWLVLVARIFFTTN